MTAQTREITETQAHRYIDPHALTHSGAHKGPHTHTPNVHRYRVP